MTDQQILQDILTRPTVPVWPHWAWAHDCGRDQAYAAARRGGEEFIRIGRNIKVISAVIRRRLGIAAPVRDAAENP